MIDLHFKMVTATMMQRGAYHRYEVWRHMEFVGEVFQFAPDVDATTPRWLAQSPDGIVHGWLTRIHTRKAAGSVLATYADRPGSRR